jgi:hypothetical protein
MESMCMLPPCRIRWEFDDVFQVGTALPVAVTQTDEVGVFEAIADRQQPSAELWRWHCSTLAGN